MVNPTLLGDRLLTVSDVASRMQIGRTRIYELLAGGDLPSVRLGRARRIRESDLAEFIANQEATVS
jgi:excisionase family DNA binding protein